MRRRKSKPHTHLSHKQREKRMCEMVRKHWSRTVTNQIRSKSNWNRRKHEQERRREGTAFARKPYKEKRGRERTKRWNRNKQ